MVQYYQDFWARRSEMLAPLTNLVGECGHTKVTRAKQTQNWAWHWDEVNQVVFDNIKTTIARCSTGLPRLFARIEICTDTLSKQLGTVITQGNTSIAFLSRKLTKMQQHYSMTKVELLVTVETL